MQRYLVLSEDGAQDVPPVYVMVNTPTEAIQRYCREVQSKEPYFKDYVEGKNIDDFLAKVLFTHDELVNLPEGKVLASPSLDVVRQKVATYFSDRPELGDLYIRYVEEDDAKVLTEEIYAFISERDIDGYDAIVDSTIEVLS